MRVIFYLFLLVSSNALAVSNAELGDKDPDLYDIMDGWRESKLEDNLKKYQKEGMTKEQAQKQVEIDKKKEMEAKANQKTFSSLFR